MRCVVKGPAYTQPLYHQVLCVWTARRNLTYCARYWVPLFLQRAVHDHYSQLVCPRKRCVIKIHAYIIIRDQQSNNAIACVSVTVSFILCHTGKHCCALCFTLRIIGGGRGTGYPRKGRCCSGEERSWCSCACCSRWKERLGRHSRWKERLGRRSSREAWGGMHGRCFWKLCSRCSTHAWHLDVFKVCNRTTTPITTTPCSAAPPAADCPRPHTQLQPLPPPPPQ